MMRRRSRLVAAVYGIVLPHTARLQVFTSVLDTTSTQELEYNDELRLSNVRESFVKFCKDRPLIR
jgi:hypothetical protein